MRQWYPIPGRLPCVAVRAFAVTLIVCLAATASATADPPPSLFGINTGTFDNDYARFVRDMTTAKALGARWIHLTGANIKFPHGRLSFKQLDSQVNRARRLHLGVLVSLGGIRGACSVRPRPADVTTCPPTTAHDLKVYAAYLKRVLRHYRGRVHYFESWVEPNQTSFWPPYPNAARYAPLLKTEDRAIRRLRGDRLVFAGPHSCGAAGRAPNR